jgi:hypothetical protein
MRQVLDELPNDVVALKKIGEKSESNEEKVQKRLMAKLEFRSSHGGETSEEYSLRCSESMKGMHVLRREFADKEIREK